METIEVELRPETLDEFVSVYQGSVRRTAERLARQHGTMEAEDLAQAIWEKIIARFESDYKGADEEFLRKAFNRLGRIILNEESLDYMYFTGKYVYSPVEVRVKLAAAAWSPLEECLDVEARVDLQAAFKNLPPKQRSAVYKRFGLGFLPSEMSQAEKRNAERGVDGITHYLNRGARIEPARLDVELEREEVEPSIVGLREVRGDGWGCSDDFGGEYR